MPSEAEILSHSSMGFRAPRLPEPPPAAPETRLAVVLKMTIIPLLRWAWPPLSFVSGFSLELFPGSVWDYIRVRFGIICVPLFLFLTFETLSLQPRAFVTLLISVTKTAGQKPLQEGRLISDS